MVSGTILMILSVALVSASSALLRAQETAQVERGMKVYAEQRCSLCHAVDGEGNERGPLDEVGSKYDLEELRLWIVEPGTMTEKTGATRRPAMPAYPNSRLPKDDLEALVAYLASLTDE